MSIGQPPVKLAVATDIAFFTVKEGKLHLCLIERMDDNSWALPGGFIKENETLDECAKRELREETLISAGKIQQFKNYSDPHRDHRGRTISVAYIAIQSSEKLKIKAGTDAKNVSWYELSNLPKNLAFDHKNIIRDATKFLSQMVIDDPELILPFLDKEFTIDEVRQIYEIVSGPNKKFNDRGNFSRWIRSLNIISPTGKEKRGNHAPAKLYERIK